MLTNSGENSTTAKSSGRRNGKEKCHKGQIPLRYSGLRQVRGWSQTC